MIIPTPQARLEVNQALKIQDLKRTGDEKNLVGWDAMNPRHPRNWSSSRKAYDASIIIFLEFYTLQLPEMHRTTLELAKPYLCLYTSRRECTSLSV
ncbi:unnamed protein product [Penicillium nalgiovense]|nr:unnamed protein product [Penicillium nalgiovense]